ncbi:MAG: hypothetical protein JO209_01125 [Acidisphaera sp.]|nr:hypothetical protein [Acidisphaera sp.]
MVTAPGNTDDTLRMGPSRRRGTRWTVLACAAIVLAGGGFLAGRVLRPPAAPPAVTPAVTQAVAPAAPALTAVPPAPPPSAFAIRTATEAEIAADVPDTLTMFRFAPNPHVIVLDFASLREQGLMLNRVAALVEKAGLPRDRVLNDAELNDAIRRSGATVETYYLGHDYSAAAIARFFALADRDGVRLYPEEEKLRALAADQGWLKPDAVGAVISVPRAGLDPIVDAAARAVILHHELSHGEYFTDPAYAGYVQRFWRNTLTDGDRAAFRDFLGREDYDTGVEDLVINEMQAYLMHTRDPRFFNARALGLPADRVALLQALFLLNMPAGWLRDCTPAPSAALPTPVRAPRRRRYRCGSVTNATALPARRPPRRRKASIAA